MHHIAKHLTIFAITTIVITELITCRSFYTAALFVAYGVYKLYED